MNAPVSDPRLDRIAVELDITVKRLQWMHAQLGEVRRAGASPVSPNPVSPNRASPMPVAATPAPTAPRDPRHPPDSPLAP